MKSGGHMAQNISTEVIDLKKLQQLQEDFCRATGLCMLCLSDEKRRITELSGTKSQLRQAGQYPDLPVVKHALERVEDGSLEDQAFEDLGTEDGGRVAAVAVRVGGVTVLYWLVFCLNTRDPGALAVFENAVDLLRDASNTLYLTKLARLNAEAQRQKSVSAEEEMSRNFQSVVALARLVQLLDSDDPVEKLLEKWLGILSSFLQVDTAQLYRMDHASNTMDVLCEWLHPGQQSIYDKIGRLKIPRFLKTEKDMIISADTADPDLQAYLQKWKLQAIIQYPVMRQAGKGALMLSLNHRKRHVWDMEEIRFSGDAVRVLQSVLGRRMQNISLTNSRQTLETMLENVGCAVYVTDIKTGKILFANRLFQHTFAQELSDNTLDQLLDRGRNEKQGNACEIHHLKKDRWYDLKLREINWVDGQPAALYSLYDITDKKIYQRRIEQQAYTDFLTGLYNRMCCERDLARQVDRARKSGMKGALLYMDLDDFKHINDGLGHQYGDVLLKAISHALQRIPGIEDTCYRMGGDEFVIVISPDRYPEYDRILEDIRDIFARPWFLKDADYYCTMSMGCVTFPDLGVTVNDLVKKADIAMYEAKKGGKNRIVTYREDLMQGSGRRLDMERDMRDATVGGCNEFEVYYQPIIDVQDGVKCAGAEALIRWNSMKLGFIPPAEFIPLAEYLGLINPIGNYVLKEACLQCKKWNDDGHPDFKINVNLSVVQLLQTDVVEIVEKTLEETGLIPRNLTLEVTESLAINDMVRMQEILNRIKALGVKIALDDFGTGYSSLNHIREIPFDLIKVDQSFVKELAADAYSQSFIKMVAELAGTLDVNVCVEGIETAAQYHALQDMKVKYIQGFYFDRPMRREDFEEKYIAKPEGNV